MLIASMMVRYDIDFVAIIQCEIYDRAFGVSTTLLFPYLVQQLYDEASVPQIPRFN